MINIEAILSLNGAGIILLLALVLNIRRILHNSLLRDKVFYAMVAINLIQCILEPVTFLIDGQFFTGAHVLIVLLNGLLFFNNINFAFLWVVYADLNIFSDVTRIRKIYSPLAIPAVIIWLGTIVNQFTPIFYEVSENNVYQRGGILFILPYIVSYSYLLYGMILIYRNKKSSKSRLFLPAVMFLIPVFVASICQFIFYGISFLWLGTAIALVSLYINVQNEASCIDSLSGLYTRQYMNSYIESKIRRVDENNHLAGIMLDIDKFKSINDTYGHLAGDDAIVSFGKILHSSVSQKDVTARFAGDEFVIIMMVDDEKKIVEAINRIRSNINQFNNTSGKQYKIMCSIGYSVYNPQNDSIDGFLNRMDVAMYAEKKAKTQSLDNQANKTN